MTTREIYKLAYREARNTYAHPAFIPFSASYDSRWDNPIRRNGLRSYVMTSIPDWLGYYYRLQVARKYNTETEEN